MIVTAEYVTEVTAPEVEIVTRTEAKNHLRVDITDDDNLIDGLIVAARQRCELYTNRAYVARTLRADIDYFDGEICLPYVPVASITHIKYYSATSPSVLTTLASSVYALSRNRVILNYGQTWPAVNPMEGAIQITYVAGYVSTSSPYDAAANVPQAVKQGCLLYVGDMYENREAQVLYPGAIQVNKTAEDLLDFYRVYR